MAPKKPDDYQKLSDLMGPYYAKLQESSGRKRRNEQLTSFAIAATAAARLCGIAKPQP